MSQINDLTHKVIHIEDLQQLRTAINLLNKYNQEVCPYIESIFETIEYNWLRYSRHDGWYLYMIFTDDIVIPLNELEQMLKDESKPT